jgi:DNA-binding transcriptional MocR family regulator
LYRYNLNPSLIYAHHCGKITVTLAKNERKGFIVTMTIPTMDVQSKQPMYKQIAQWIGSQIQTGQLEYHQKLPTHRALADQLGVTIGTVTRAYAEAERQGLVEARVGAGTFVRNPNQGGWVFEEQQEHVKCQLGYNIPPFIERDQMISQAMTKLSQSPQLLNQLMLYQSAVGNLGHKNTLCDWLKTHNVDLSPERLLFCHGAQHALQLIMDGFCSAGDTLLVEEKTYPGLLNAAKQKQLTLKAIAMDEHGITPQSLETACQRFRPRFVYLTPTLQNPTTVTMPIERRHAIIDLCKRYEVIIIEDDINGLLEPNAPTPMVNLAPEQVIYVNAFSKTLAPGLRVGFLHMPKPLFSTLAQTLQNHSWMVSPLLIALCCQLIESGDADNVLKRVQQEMQQRYQIVDRYLSKYRIMGSENGFHLWLPLPSHWKLSEFVNQADQQGLTIKSAELFAPPATHIEPAVRLSVSAPLDKAELEQGLQDLVALLESQPDQSFVL